MSENSNSNPESSIPKSEFDLSTLDNIKPVSKFIPEFDLVKLDNLKPDPQFAKDQEKRAEINNKPFFIRPVARFLMERRMKLEKQVTGNVINTLKESGAIDKNYDPRAARPIEEQQEASKKKGWIESKAEDRLKAADPQQTEASDTSDQLTTVPTDTRPQIKEQSDDSELIALKDSPVIKNESSPESHADFSTEPNQQKKENTTLHEGVNKLNDLVQESKKKKNESDEADNLTVDAFLKLDPKIQLEQINTLDNRLRQLCLNKLKDQNGTQISKEDVMNQSNINQQTKNIIWEKLKKYKLKNASSLALVIGLMIAQTITQEAKQSERRAA